MAGSDSLLDGIRRILIDVVNRAIDTATRRPGKHAARQSKPEAKFAPLKHSESKDSTSATPGATAYPGDFRGTPNFEYRPRNDRFPDPGEIVWTWVPYEEDHSLGKDRPVLLIGRDGDWLLGLQITSQDHDRDAAQEARAGRFWMDIGSGSWDQRGRPSEARLNRIIRVDAAGVRRIGAILDQSIFEQVVAGVSRYY